VAEPRRILHIQKATGIAGAERHLLTLLEHVDRSRFAFDFLLLIESVENVREYKRLLEGLDVPTATVRIRRHIDPRCLWDVLRFIRRGRYDIVHTHLVHGDLYGTVAAKLAGVPHVLSSKHGYNDFEANSRAYRINGVLERYVDAVITICDALQEKVHSFEGVPKEKMRTIHYGLDGAEADPDARRRIRTELGILPDQFLVGCVGRLVNFKGFKYLIRAASRLKTSVPDAVVVIAGEGPLRSELEKEIHDLGVAATVRLLGWRSDACDIMAAADVFALPSLGEGFGLVLLEAMAQRTAIVASRAMSVPEIVVDGITGILVNPADDTDLAKALETLALNPGLRRQFAEAGYERLHREFSVEAMVRKTERVYLELAGAV
jgi:glycosyltransferase involved in cell wall biosynthesis